MDGKEICKFCGLKFGSKSVLEIHYSIVHQGEEQINKSDSIQRIPSQKMLSKQKKKVTEVSFSLCQRNLIKTFQIEVMIALITKMAMISYKRSLVLLEGYMCL